MQGACKNYSKKHIIICKKQYYTTKYGEKKLAKTVHSKNIKYIVKAANIYRSFSNCQF